MTAATQTARINPDIVDATGALRCVEGAAVFTAAARDQMEKLALRAEAGLRSTSAPIVGEVRKFKTSIATCLGNIQRLVEEHVDHVRTQAELAADANLARAAVGYLDALKRGGFGSAGVAGGGAGGGGAATAAPATAASGATTYEIDAANVRGPLAAEKAMRSAADALGIGQAAALASLRQRLIVLGVAADSVSPTLLARINGELTVLLKAGHAHADEFARQVRIARAKVAANKALANTQAGGWLDPKNLH